MPRPCVAKQVPSNAKCCQQNVFIILTISIDDVVAHKADVTEELQNTIWNGYQSLSRGGWKDSLRMALGLLLRKLVFHTQANPGVWRGTPS